MTRPDTLRAVWRKSNRSESGEGACVEVAAAWRKSRRSESEQGTCVEVARGARMVAVRDSKDPDGPVLALAPDAWRGLLGTLKQQGGNS